MLQKTTRCSYTKIAEKQICGDDKNCQSPQLMRPEKPNNAIRLKHPAVHTKKNATMDVTSEKLSHKSPVNTKVQVQRRNINTCVKGTLRPNLNL